MHNRANLDHRVRIPGSSVFLRAAEVAPASRLKSTMHLPKRLRIAKGKRKSATCEAGAAIRRGHRDIASTLVGCPTPAEVKQNVKCIQQPIDIGLFSEVQEILRPIQNQTWTSGRAENN